MEAVAEPVDLPTHRLVVEQFVELPVGGFGDLGVGEHACVGEQRRRGFGNIVVGGIGSGLHIGLADHVLRFGVDQFDQIFHFAVLQLLRGAVGAVERQNAGGGGKQQQAQANVQTDAYLQRSEVKQLHAIVFFQTGIAARAVLTFFDKPADTAHVFNHIVAEFFA